MNPRGGWFPTSYWLCGDVVDDYSGVLLPVDAVLGKLDMQFGLFDEQTQARLATFDAVTHKR